MFMTPLNSPFEAVDKILEREKGNDDFSILDIHAEATSEKVAIAKGMRLYYRYRDDGPHKQHFGNQNPNYCW